MIRWAWRLLLVLGAALAIGAELDRASYLRPELSIMVPQPFRSFAQPTTAVIALGTGDSSESLKEARRLVQRRPIPAEHLFTLAMAELRNGNPRGFADSFRAASTRGWRYAPLQLAAAQAALSAGDVKAAANRVAAQWAESPENPSVGQHTKQVLESPGGPEAFAVPLAQTHVWSDSFLARLPGLTTPAIAARTIIAAQGAGAKFDCRSLARLERALVARGKAGSRQTFHCE